MCESFFDDLNIVIETIDIEIWIDSKMSWKKSNDDERRDSYSFLSIIFSVHKTHECRSSNQYCSHSECWMIPRPGWCLEILFLMDKYMSEINQEKSKSKPNQWRDKESNDDFLSLSPMWYNTRSSRHKHQCDAHSENRANECMRARYREC